MKNMPKIPFKTLYDRFDSVTASYIERFNDLPMFQDGIHGMRGVIAEEIPKAQINQMRHTVWDVLKKICFVITHRPVLTHCDRSIILSSDPRIDEFEIASLTSYPLSTLQYKKIPLLSRRISFFSVIWPSIRLLTLALSTQLVRWNEACYLLIRLLGFYHVYQFIILDGIRHIITNNTAFDTCVAIILRANKENIHTIKIDYFLNNCHTGDSKKIFAKYYWAFDAAHRQFYKQFEYNQGVVFTEHFGKINLDLIANYQSLPIENSPKKIIVYLTSHSMCVEADEFYLKECIQFISQHTAYTLVIKIHPLDQRDYTRFISQGVTLSRENGDAYFKLVRQAYCVLSIYSTLTIASKLINDRCAWLQYFDDGNKAYYGFGDALSAYIGYMDIIMSQTELHHFLLSMTLPTTSIHFQEHLLPSYPNAKSRFKDFISNLP